MPGFKIHISASTTLGIAYGGAAFALYGVPAPTAAVATVLCSVAGMLPDLDSGPGRPLHESVCFAAAAVPMMMVDRFKHWGWDNESMILAGAIVYLFIRFVLGEMLKKFTVHRGIFHSLPVALTFCEMAFLVCTAGDLNMRYFKAGGIAIGFMSHLILDEIWSVDFKNHRLKSSFGTALKMWSDCGWATALAYAITIGFTVLTLNDPIWESASPEEEQLHKIASRIVTDVDTVEQDARQRFPQQPSPARQSYSQPVYQPQTAPQQTAPQQNYQASSYPQQQAYSQQSSPPKVYQQPTYQQQSPPQAAYQQPSYPQQSYSQQNYQQPSFSPQNYQQPGYSAQNYQPPSYPAQGYQPQGYPQQSFPQQGYQPQVVPQQGYQGQMPYGQGQGAGDPYQQQ